MIDSWLSKTKFKDMYEKFVRKFFLGKVSANQLTIIGLIFGLVGSFLIYLSSLLEDFLIIMMIASVSIVSISFVIDTIDGSVARYEGPTSFGGILDIFCDRLVEIAIIISLVASDSQNLLWAGMFSLAAIILCISMFLIVGGINKRSGVENTSKVITYQNGLMERSETFLFFLAMIILIPWRLILLWIFSGLVFTTAILRLIKAHKLFQE
ncbi:MAG: CDP-alcohol phosphatidyltransferase family protein [Candidatus Lokiarchaeota archaeon]|nr:CDP-alcohol phosphatidyltransferase family protein [Candidatus Lokiarchaeota archaeon]